MTLHINKILELPSINYKPTSMRLFNSYNENMQVLKALGTDISRTNPLLSTFILKKMDKDLRKRFEHEYAQSHKDPDGDYDSVIPEASDIVNFLNQECIELEDASLSEPLIVKQLSRCNTYSHSSSLSQKRTLLPLIKKLVCLLPPLPQLTIGRCVYIVKKRITKFISVRDLKI